MRRIFRAVLALLIALISAINVFAAKTYTVEPSRVTLYASTTTMRVGQTREISYELNWPRMSYYLDRNKDITAAELAAMDYSTSGNATRGVFIKNGIDEITWTSSDPDIAEVSEYGEVTARAVGTVSVTMAVRGPNSAGRVVELASKEIELTVLEKRDIDDPERYMNDRDKPAAEPEKNYANGEISASELSALVKGAAKNGASKVTVRNAAQVSAQALRAAAKAAADTGAKATLSFDTMSGNSVGGRVTLDPAIAAEAQGSYKLDVTTTGEAIDAAAAKVKHLYKNRFFVVKAGQGSWGGNVRYAVKSGLNYVRARDLVLYSLNPQTGACAAITGDVNFATDMNGYIRFTTAKGGWLVLSDGELEKWNYGTN